MARSDAILKRLLALHPKVMDLSLGRMEHLLAILDHPERKLPPVIHVAGTNGKGSTIATMRACLEVAGKSVHAYTSPHLVRFHERIYMGAPGGGAPISEPALIDLLEECEEANGADAITYFEITTAAALLAFPRTPADYLLLEVGLGGRFDATNVIDEPALCAITPVDIDHQHFLGDTIEEIAFEKAGILKPGVPCIVGPQRDATRGVIERRAEEIGAPLLIAGQDFQAFEERGRLVYQDEAGLLDLPLPKLAGRFQIENAGTAIAILRALDDAQIGENAIAEGLTTTKWPARMQLLSGGELTSTFQPGTELWLDGGHNTHAANALAVSLAEIEERAPKPLVIVTGMLNTKPPQEFLASLTGLAKHVITLTIPEEPNAVPANELARVSGALGFSAQTADTIEQALDMANKVVDEPARILVCGSLYLAGHVLALEYGEEKIGPSGTSKL
ncbi:MAG: bifunctional folylpolyglutamate synthase/dihydrofolate synthase [Hyphomicrobiales bacterium]